MAEGPKRDQTRLSVCLSASFWSASGLEHNSLWTLLLPWPTHPSRETM